MSILIWLAAGLIAVVLIIKRYGSPIQTTKIGGATTVLRVGRGAMVTWRWTRRLLFLPVIPKLAAVVLVFIAIALAASVFMPDVTGEAWDNAKFANPKLILALMLACVASLILYITNIATTSATTTKTHSSSMGSLIGSILGIAVILVILFFGGKLAYQAYEGSSKKAEMVWPWTGEEVVVYAASTEGVRIPLGYEGQKIIATAEKTLFDRVGGDRKKVIISTKGRFCYAVTSDHAYPQKAHDWFIRLRYQGVTDQEVPPSPNPARGFKFENMVWQERIGYTELLYRGDVPGQLYIFVPRNKGCSP